MIKKSLFFVMFLFAFYGLVHAQNILHRDTTWLRWEQDSTMDMLLSLNARFNVKHSEGKLLLTAYLPGICNEYPAVYMVDTATKKLHRVNFSNLPLSIQTSKMPFAPDDFIFLSEENRILWYVGYIIAITDTQYNYIHSYWSPYEKNNQIYAPAYASSVFVVDSFLLFPMGSWHWKQKKSGEIELKKGNLIKPGFGLIPLQAALNFRKKRIYFSGIVNVDLCGSVMDYEGFINRSYFPGSDKKSVWFTDDFARHIVHYTLIDGSHICYRLPELILKNDTHYFQFPQQLDIRTPHACLISEGSSTGKTVGRMYQHRLFYQPDMKRILRVCILATADTGFITVLDSQSGIENFYTNHAGERTYTLFQYLSIESDMEIISQRLVPIEESIDVFHCAGNEWTGFKQIFDGQYFRPALVRWVMDDSVLDNK